MQMARGSLLVSRLYGGKFSQSFFLSAAICSIISFPLASITHSAESVDYTIENIAEGMLAAQSQFTDLHLTYVSQQHLVDGRVRISKAEYAQKLPAKMYYLDRSISYLDPNTEEVTSGESLLTTFNGEATLRLNREVRSHGLMMAGIFPGYQAGEFRTIDVSPHSLIWEIAPTLSYATELLNKDNVISIESMEKLEDIQTVKISGKIWKGRAKLEIWVSPDRGFLPLKMRLYRVEDNMALEERSLSDLIKLPNGMWYPKEMKTGYEIKPNEYSISTVETSALPDAFFRPTLPPNTHVSDHVLKITYTLKDAEDAGLKSLGTDQSKESVESQTEHLMEDYVRIANQKRMHTATETVITDSCSNPSIEPNMESTDRQTTKVLNQKTVAIVLLVAVVLVVSVLFIKCRRTSQRSID